jgi:hypothetical protein
MSDIDPGENSPVQSERSTKWILGIIAAVVLVAAIVYGMSDRANRTAAIPDVTTVQSNQQPGGPVRGAPATNR